MDFLSTRLPHVAHKVLPTACVIVSVTWYFLTNCPKSHSAGNTTGGHPGLDLELLLTGELKRLPFPSALLPVPSAVTTPDPPGCNKTSSFEPSQSRILQPKRFGSHDPRLDRSWMKLYAVALRTGSSCSVRKLGTPGGNSMNQHETNSSLANENYKI